MVLEGLKKGFEDLKSDIGRKMGERRKEKLRRKIIEELEPDIPSEEEIKRMLEIAEEQKLTNPKDIISVFLDEKLREKRKEILKEDAKRSWQSFQKDLSLIRELKIPEEDKEVMRKKLYRQHLERIGEKVEEKIEEKLERKKPRGLWLGKVLEPIHVLEPEETRLLRAIPWAKRRLDGIARTKNKEVVIRYKTEKMKELAKEINLEEAKKKVLELQKELKALEKEKKEIEDRILHGEKGLNEVLNSKNEELNRRQEEYLKEREEYLKNLRRLEAFMTDTSTDFEVLKEILMGEVPKVLEETCKRFNIVHFRDDVRKSLENFAIAEAETMVRNNYKTLYQSFSGWFVKEIYRPIEGLSSSAYGIIEYSWNFLFEFIFSPVVTGTVLVWILFSIFIRYAMTGPTLAVLIITIIITVIMSLSKFWSEEYEKNR